MSAARHLRGRVVLVTGAGVGIGAATAPLRGLRPEAVDRRVVGQLTGCRSGARVAAVDG